MALSPRSFAVVTLLSVACSTGALPPTLHATAPPPDDATADVEPPPELPLAPLPGGWDTVSEREFEELALERLPDGPHRFSEEDLAVLTEALGRPPVAVAVRAAVLLGRSGSPEAGEHLLTRLQTRTLGPERNSDAADVVAAGVLATWPVEMPHLTAALAALAIGSDPHPDLEVRVECARAALRRGEDEVIPFLLEVLRIGTERGRESGLFWPPPLRSAWCRERAAEVLAWRADVPNRFSADASLADREAAADTLERALAK